MLQALSEPGSRLRVLAVRLLARLGLGESSFLLVLAVIVGAVTAVAAVGFHELILAVHVSPRPAGVLVTEEGGARSRHDHRKGGGDDG